MDTGPTQLIDEVAAGRRTACSQLHLALLDWWTEDTAHFDSVLDQLAFRAARGEGLATELVLTIIHQLGLARPAILRLTVNPEIVAEVAQTTLIKVERHLAQFEGRSSLRAWLSAIARNEALTHFRREERHAEPVPGASPIVENRSVDGKSLSSSVATRLTIREAVDRLPEPFGEAIRLRVIDQRSYEEIADIQGVPVGTVRSRLSRGRALLNEQLAI